MDSNTAKLLLQSLLERFDKSNAEVFLTSIEAEALRTLLGDGKENSESIVSATEATPDTSIKKSYTVAYPDPSLIDDGHIMCLDFGTSFSKAFACTDDDPEDVPELFPLVLGTNESDEPQLLLPSELFIDDGVMYLGRAARAQFDSVEAPQDRLIDSPKQFITLTQDVGALHGRKLDAAQDPTSTFSQRDALVIYLAHLNLLAEKSLHDQGISVDLKRRYAHPAWKADHFQKNSREMRRIIAEAIALSRCCDDALKESLAVDIAKDLVNQARQLSDDDLPFSLIGDPVLEATAAGAGALIGTPEGNRIPYVILDIGAGTTDVAGCICVNNPAKSRVTVAEVSPAANAINQAGNIIDNLLLKLILNKSHLADGTQEYRRVQSALKRTIRSNKELLFTQGSVTVSTVTGDVIDVELEEFLEEKSVKNLFKKITDLVETAAFYVAGDAKEVRVAPTGGGANLPLVRELDGSQIEKEGKRLKLTLVGSMPTALEEVYPQLSDPYPQIAVAVGGALPSLPVQVKSIAEGISDPGKRYIAPMYKS